MSDDLYVFDDARSPSGALTAIVTGIASAVAAVAITTAVAAPNQTSPEVQQANAPAEAATNNAPVEAAPANETQAKANAQQASRVVYYTKTGGSQAKKTTTPAKVTPSAPAIAPVGNVTSPTWTQSATGNTSGPTASGSGNKTSPTSASGTRERDDDD